VRRDSPQRSAASNALKLKPAGNGGFSIAKTALPTCPICTDSMIATEASAFLTDDVVSYLWTYDTCGYGFVTKHAFRPMTCNCCEETLTWPSNDFFGHDAPSAVTIAGIASENFGNQSWPRASGFKA
jgi:hypothetical protein